MNSIDSRPETAGDPDYSLFDHVPAGVFILSANYRIVFWNRSLEAWTMLEREALLGTDIFLHFPHLDSPKYRKRINDIFSGGSPTVFSSQLHRYLIPSPLPGGKFRIQYTMVTGIPTGTPGEIHALFSIQDVTSLSEAINSYNLEHRKLLSEMEVRKKAEAELKKLNKVLKERVIRDGLTGLHNHRHFWNVMRRDFQLAMRHRTDLSLLLIDLDLFKKVNDVYGHLFGDLVLKGIGKIILKSVRKTDIVSRYGGEEFAVLLPATNISGAGVIAENIRRAIEQHSFRSAHEKIRVTASIGVASLIDHGPGSPQKLLDMADSALYCSKGQGRNMIVIYSDASDGEPV
jgi:diguanylate cyclase (GGDEF)-like protein/PAS domain S-box-containing protein